MEYEKYVIVNPAAGKGKGAIFLRKYLNALNKLGVKKENILVTNGKDHASILTKDLSLSENIIYCVGGDGTLNEIVNGLGELSKAKLGVIPIGSGNDFARAIGYYQNKLKLNDYFNSSSFVKSDIGQLRVLSNESVLLERKFISSLGIGFDASVASKIRTIKYIKGLPLYLTSVFVTLKEYNAPQSQIKISAAEEVSISDKIFLFTIGNTSTAGGGFKLNPNARIDDGRLDLCLAKNVSKSTILKVLPKALNGTHIFDRHISSFTFKKVIYKTNEKVVIHTDGEVYNFSEGEKVFEIGLIPNKVAVKSYSN